MFRSTKKKTSSPEDEIGIKKKKTSNSTSKISEKLWRLNFAIIFWLVLLTIFLIIVGAISLRGLSTESDFIAIQNSTTPTLTAAQHSHIIAPLVDNTDLYISVCTNLSPNPSGTTEFKGRTVIAYQCDEPINSCAMNPCNTTSGRCEATPIPGAECFLDTQCGVGGACNTDTCQCQSLPNSTVGCTEDSQCTVVEDRGICSRNFCNVNGVCEEEILGDGVCWGDFQCDSATEYCDQLVCNCVDRPQIPCTVNSDCPDISDRGDCVTNICDNFRCRELTLGECWFDQQCGGMNMTCDGESCTCRSSSTIQCSVDDDCPIISDRGGCVVNQCLANNTCAEVTLGECWYGGQCNQPSEFCNQTSCMCDLEPVLQCQQDIDCGDISDRGNCVTKQCQSNECVEVTLGECWYDQQCTVPGEVCDEGSCSCVPVTSIPCSFDFECPNITDRGPCVSYECRSNRCEEVIHGLGDCWFSDQCGDGEACNTLTCGCVPLSDTCVSGYDIRTLPDPLSLLNLVCGVSITISMEHIVTLCVDDSAGVQDVFVLELFTRTGSIWLWSSETTSSVFNNGIPTFDAGAVDSFGTLVGFIGRDVTAVQPQASTVELYRIIISNQLALVQTILLPTTSDEFVDICIYEETIVVVSQNAFIYEPSGVDTWSLEQQINGTQTFIKCSIWDDGLVLSYERTPTGDSYLSYVLNAGTWTLADTGTTPSIDGSWGSVVVDTIDQDTLLDFPFLVYSTPREIPVSIMDVNSATGISLPSVTISSAGTGIISSYDRNVFVGSALGINIVPSLSFQDRISGATTQNDIWDDDVALFANTTAYANFCPRS